GKSRGRTKGQLSLSLGENIAEPAPSMMKPKSLLNRNSQFSLYKLNRYLQFFQPEGNRRLEVRVAK
ncbi:hypothetical protein, partial [Cloacibacillus porcorum]